MPCRARRRDSAETIAKLPIDQHGDEATLYATGWADELLEEGDAEGAAVWRAIFRR